MRASRVVKVPEPAVVESAGISAEGSSAGVGEVGSSPSDWEGSVSRGSFGHEWEGEEGG